MADNEIVLRNGGRLTSDTELFNRGEGGLFNKRVGFVRDLFLAMDRSQSPHASLRDDSRIIEALREILESMRRDELQERYQAIIDSFQKYVTHGMEDKLARIDDLCTEGAPGFKRAFEKELEDFHIYRFNSLWGLEEKLTPIVTAANAYLVVLSIGFHSLTIRCNESAHLDVVVLPKIEAVIGMLKRRLESTLLLGGKAKKSLIGALLFSGDIRFHKYRPYCSEYLGEEGLQRLVVSANEIIREDGYYEGHRVGSELPRQTEIMFADMLIELIDRFEALKKIRLSFEPGAAPSPVPTAISALPGGAKLAITTQGEEQ